MSPLPKSSRRLALALATAVAVTTIASGCASPDLPNAKAVLADKCSRCHSADRAQPGAYPRDVATRLVQDMEERGAELTDPERQSVINYLSSR